LKADRATHEALGEMLARFCSAFERRDADAIKGLFAPDGDVAMVTSEEALIQGQEALDSFLRSYEEGSTAYSWEWKSIDVSAAGGVGWLLALGTETADSGGDLVSHPYRMTMVFKRREGRWLLVQAHGSSPQPSA
jgi:ketosteroid isomerase-like protein